MISANALSSCTWGSLPPRTQSIDLFHNPQIASKIFPKLPKFTNMGSLGNLSPGYGTGLMRLAKIGIIVARHFLFQRRRIGMWCVALLAVGILFCCVDVTDAASPAALAPAIKPLAHIAMWVITAITFFCNRQNLAARNF